ncbi:hypothetical protein BC937DRAFT_87239 [Endogone sp. FLAS-F59071]|nr:hypothetical protein BC937DRAFT_87239 [Endogone sp. FLAS-F59071]|eukprot:RUS19587.1 hypothetical protein BC937DRAFT_87239 [Endogone sp. FLAS-F59071]
MGSSSAACVVDGLHDECWGKGKGQSLKLCKRDNWGKVYSMFPLKITLHKQQKAIQSLSKNNKDKRRYFTSRSLLYEDDSPTYCVPAGQVKGSSFAFTSRRKDANR